MSASGADYGWAERPDAPSERPEYPVLAGWVGRGERVLDVGCGDGSLGARLVAACGATVAGLELDPTGVERARARGVDARVADADAPFPFAADAFDVAVCNVTLMMVRRPRHVLEEMLRVAPRALVSFPNVAHWAARLQLAGGRFPRKPLYGYAWYETRHIHLFSWADFGALASELGAPIGRTEHFGRDSRTPSALARAWPNLFAALCLAELKRR